MILLTTHLYGYTIFLFLKISSPITVLLASLFPRTYISFLKGNLFSFENNCWEACLRKGIEMFLLHFEKKKVFLSRNICPIIEQNQYEVRAWWTGSCWKARIL